MDLPGKSVGQPSKLQPWPSLGHFAVDTHADLHKEQKQQDVGKGSVSRTLEAKAVVLGRSISGRCTLAELHSRHWYSGHIVCRVSLVAAIAIMVVLALADPEHMMEVAKEVSCHGYYEHGCVPWHMVLVSPDSELLTKLFP